MTNTKENGLETILVNHLVNNNGYQQLSDNEYDKTLALVPTWLEDFIRATQPEIVESTCCFATNESRRKFYNILEDDLTKRGVIDLLRNGFRFNGTHFSLYFPTPSPQNNTAKQLYERNTFGVIRQLHYATTNDNSIDVVLFVNGLPIITIELKNHYTGQTVDNAIRQYQTDRDPRELLLRPKRCAVHFAVDDNQVFMCSALKGKESWFLPFNRGVNGGAGNPVIPNDTMTAYLWKDILTKETLSLILENFAQVTRTRDKKTGKEHEHIIWPRYHQLDAVRSLIAATQAKSVGQRFLIQHSAGSGKSNSITWLAYQLVLLQQNQQPLFDSVVVVTDRVNLDRQIRDNICSFMRLQNNVDWADDSEKLRTLLQGGKKIIVTTIHKFSFILDEIGNSLKNKHFAIIIDEAHSSQNGSMASNLATGISGNAQTDDDEDIEDQINRLIEGRKLAHNANYYAFTATPKNKTLEMFGQRSQTPSGEVTFQPFHEYTMKQAIEEGFILDVLKCYIPYASYYKVLKAVENDPEFDSKKARAKIRAYVEAQPETIEKKAQIIVDHFCTQVYSKIGGQARAMVVTSSIERAIEFYKVITRLLQQRQSPYRAIVAFSDKEINGRVVTEASINGFPSSEIEDRMEQEPYRILVVADKFQTGYDQPLLHTMYVDKQLSDLKAVQTLSRLNRCHPKKIDTFVLDFANDVETIQRAFQRYYKTTILDGESDPHKLDDLINTIDDANFYTTDDIEQTVALKLSGNDDDRPRIDAILDAVVERFKSELDTEAQVRTKSAIKNYCRVYPFFASIIPFKSQDWEKRYIFYSLLVHKLPKLKGEDFTEGLIETIDFDKYRIAKQEEQRIILENTDSPVDPVPVGQGAGMYQPEIEKLSKIVDDFNLEFGNIQWKNIDEVKRQIQELPARIAQNEDFSNALKNSDIETAQREFYDAMQKVVAAMLAEKTEFVDNYFKNDDFRNFVNTRVFSATTAQLQQH